MKVLLVNPEFPDTYWSFRHALPFEGKRCVSTARSANRLGAAAAVMGEKAG